MAVRRSDVGDGDEAPARRGGRRGMKRNRDPAHLKLTALLRERASLEGRLRTVEKALARVEALQRTATGYRSRLREIDAGLRPLRDGLPPAAAPAASAPPTGDAFHGIPFGPTPTAVPERPVVRTAPERSGGTTRNKVIRAIIGLGGEPFSSSLIATQTGLPQGTVIALCLNLYHDAKLQRVSNNRYRATALLGPD